MFLLLQNITLNVNQKNKFLRMKKKFTLKKQLQFLMCIVLLLMVAGQLNAQTTYYWVGGTGYVTSPASWATAANWKTVLGGASGTTRTPAADDILIFDGTDIGSGATGTVYVGSLPTQTIGKLILQSGANIIFATTSRQSANAGIIALLNSGVTAGAFNTIGATTACSYGTTALTAANIGDIVYNQFSTSAPVNVGQILTNTTGSNVYTSYSISGQSAQTLYKANILSISQAGGFLIDGSSTLNLSTGHAFAIKLLNGASGTVSGTINVTCAGQRIITQDATYAAASGALTFVSGSAFNITRTIYGNTFDYYANSTNDNVIFQSGASYNIVPPVTATATLTIGTGSNAGKLSMNITNRGSGYVAPPTYTITDPGTTSGTAITTTSFSLSAGGISSNAASAGGTMNTSVSNVGTGYTVAPTITFVTPVAQAATGAGLPFPFNGNVTASVIKFNKGSTFSLNGTTYTNTAFGTRTFPNFKLINGSNLTLAASGGTGTITVDTLTFSGGKLTLGTASNGLTISSTGNIGFSSTNDTLALGGKSFLLKSDNAGTAGIGAVTGFNAVTGATNVTVERYIPSNSRKSYTMVTSPVSSPTINAAWQEAGAATAGYGTQITGGTTGTAANNGFDTTSASGLPSIFTYNDGNTPGTKWVGLTNTNVNTLAPGAGYLLYVRGDRTIAPGSAAVSNTTLRATGTVTIGDVTPTLTTTDANLFNLVANPYPCAVTWTAVTKSNITGSFYTYDPNLGFFITSNGTTVSPSSSGTGTSQQQANVIQSGQAFFIQNAASGTPSITFTEAAKTTAATTTSATTVFGDEAPASQLNINIYSKNNELADGVVALFGNNYKAGIAKEDAAKMDNFNETFALTRNNNRLSIEGRPTIKGNDTLFFAMSNFSKKEYVLKIDGSNFSEANATLIDNYTGTKTALDLAAINTYSFTVNGDAASANSNRFMITFGSTANIAAGETTDNNASLFVKVSPNPVSNQLQVNFKTAATENTVIKVINSLGQTVKTVNAGKVNAGNISIPTTSLANGLYTVQLISGNKNIASHKIVKQ